MRPEDFASQLFATIVQGNTKIYSDIFNSTERERVGDEHWRMALQLYDSIGEEQRGVLLRIMRQVTIDAISSILAIVDGTTSLEAPGGAAHIEVSIEAGGLRLSGNLQDLFLAIAENESRSTG